MDLLTETGRDESRRSWRTGTGRSVAPGARRRRTRFAVVFATCGLIATLLPTGASAGEALVAVAANFTEVVGRLEADFERTTGHDLTVTTGSTGLLYAQIRSGAPYDVLLAADRLRPELLEKEGRAVAGSRFTYAVGRLTLWSAAPELVSTDGAETLRAGAFRKLAIANPDLAPYGVAARETLAALGLLETLGDRIVMGENIGQTHALVATGNAELGFVALSYVLSPGNRIPGSRWDVPQELHAPIRQDAVLLTRGAANAAARDFLEYLKRDEARAVIESFGYGVE
jgi:molybdate transport system substrate-binding protein